MKDVISIAIETSCRQGGAALGRGESLVKAIDFDAASRHATQLVSRLKELLEAEGLTPSDVRQVYVSAGPGSFTGLRVGVTVVRTLAQALPRVRCVAVPTAQAVAENARDLPWEHLGVILDVKDNTVYAATFHRPRGLIVPAEPPQLISPEHFLARCPRPILLSGEGLGHHDFTSPGITLAEAPLRLPRAEGVWRVGRQMAAEGAFTEYHQLLPIYSRKPEAIRLWERRQAPPAGPNET